MRLLVFGLAVCIVSVALGSAASADTIYLISNGHSSAGTAINNLNTLGHSVTVSGTHLSDYSTYDQVWDLSYAHVYTPSERQTMSAFLDAGGGLYITGENASFDARNGSINGFLNEIGAGSVGFAGSTSNFDNQNVTSAGQVVNTVHPFSSYQTYWARTVGAPSSGFLVSESTSVPGSGSLVGWDFGDLPNHSQARMLVGFDIELHDNGINWTENVVTYLGASAIPEPSSGLILSAFLLPAICFSRRRMCRQK